MTLQQMAMDPWCRGYVAGVLATALPRLVLDLWSRWMDRRAAAQEAVR